MISLLGSFSLSFFSYFSCFPLFFSYIHTPTHTHITNRVNDVIVFQGYLQQVDVYISLFFNNNFIYLHLNFLKLCRLYGVIAHMVLYIPPPLFYTKPLEKKKLFVDLTLLYQLLQSFLVFTHPHTHTLTHTHIHTHIHIHYHIHKGNMIGKIHF